MAKNKIPEIEAREGRSIVDVLHDLYTKHGDQPATQKLVARELGISQPTLSQWLIRLRLKQRTQLMPDDGKSPTLTYNPDLPMLPGFEPPDEKGGDAGDV